MSFKIIYTDINPKKIIKDEEDEEDYNEMYFSYDYDTDKLKEILGKIGDCNTGDILCVDPENRYRNYGLYIIIKDINNNIRITQFSFNITGVNDLYSDYGFLLPVRTYTENMSLYGYIYHQPVLVDKLLTVCKKITKINKLEKFRNWYIYIEYNSPQFIENYDDSNLEYVYRIFEVNGIMQLQYVNIYTLKNFNDDSIILSPSIEF
jgi:hypothetical protein